MSTQIRFLKRAQSKSARRWFLLRFLRRQYQFISFFAMLAFGCVLLFALFPKLAVNIWSELCEHSAVHDYLRTGGVS